MRHDLHGITYLNEVLDLCLREAEEQTRMLTIAEVELACEILKILFNLTVSIDKNNLDEVGINVCGYICVISFVHIFMLKIKAINYCRACTTTTSFCLHSLCNILFFLQVKLQHTQKLSYFLL